MRSTSIWSKRGIKKRSKLFTNITDELRYARSVSLKILLSHSRSLMVIRNAIIRYIAHEFLLAIHSDYGPIVSQIKRNIDRNSRFFHNTPITRLHSTPRLAQESPSKFRHNISCRKTTLWLKKTRQLWQTITTTQFSRF